MWLNGCLKGVHKFEPRYDERPVGNFKVNATTVYDDEAFRSLIYYKVYVHDICVRCGKTVQRPPA